MPGKELKDILEWRNKLDNFSAIEINSKNISLMKLCAFKNNITNFKIFQGDVDDIIKKGKDNFGNKLEFPFGVIFLDYYGGTIYKKLSRIDAIKDLIEKQKGIGKSFGPTKFLFFITFNIKDCFFGGSIRDMELIKLKNNLIDFCLLDSFKNTIEDWYIKCKSSSDEIKIKIFFTYFVKKLAEDNNFSITVHSPYFYIGSDDAKMMHFVFSMSEKQIKPTGTKSEQSLIDVINLSLNVVNNGRIVVKKDKNVFLKL